MGLFSRWTKQPTKPLHKNLQETYQATLENIVNSPEDLKQFLSLSAQLYKYDMDSLLAIYAQAPQAKFVANFATWRSIDRTPVNGSKAIKILKQKENGFFYHENVFEVSQTSGQSFSFPNWLMEPVEFETLMSKIKEKQATITWEQDLSPEQTLNQLITSKVSSMTHHQLDQTTTSQLVDVSSYLILAKLGQNPSYDSIKESAQTLFSQEEQLIKQLPLLLSLNQVTLSDIQQTKKESQKEKEQYHERERTNGRTRKINSLRRGTESKRELSSSNRANSQPELRGRGGRSTVSDNGRATKQSSPNSKREMDSTIPDDLSASEIPGVTVDGQLDENITENGRGVSSTVRDNLRSTEPERDTRNGHVEEDSTTQSIKSSSRRDSQSTTVSDSLDTTSSVLTEEWTELPKDYTYQRLNEKAYLINEKGDFEKEAVAILLEDGKIYYKPYETKQEQVSELSETPDITQTDLFSFASTNPVKEEKTSEAKTVGTKPEKTSIEPTKQEPIDFAFPEKDSVPFYSQSPKEKLADNLAALRLLKTIETENRLATSSEQEILAKYVGWGGLSEVFNEEGSKFNQEKEELKTLLSEEEYASARESVLTAYYTDPLIIKEMYHSLERFGFSSGRILDPAMGTGNFFAAMPEEMKANSDLYGVELDSLSARLSKQLQQKTAIQATGFEETRFTNGSLDVVIANVPFADMKLKDNKTLKKYYIHDYFIKKSLDLVHEGGIVAVVTSSGTMDKKDSSFRQEIAQKADLIGGVRLPNTAFKSLAGTEVTTDILFFRKNNPQLALEQELEEENALPKWVETVSEKSGTFLADGTEQPPLRVNRYFRENFRTNTLGRYHFKNFRGGTYTLNPRDNGVTWQEELPKSLSTLNGTYLSAEALKLDLPEVLPEKIEEERQQSFTNLPIPKFSYYDHHGEILYNGMNGIEHLNLNRTAVKRMQQMIQIKDLVVDIIDYQQQPSFDSAIFETKLGTLNQVYDSFVKKYQFLNQPINSRLFHDDDRHSLLMSIEIPQKDGNFQKSAIFTEPTIRPIEPVTSVPSAIEALNQSLATRGKVDISFMRKLYSVPEEQLLEELKGHIFVDGQLFIENEEHFKDCYVTKEEFLSGDVKNKLVLSQALAAKYPVFHDNVEALKPVIPKDLEINDIQYELGSSWLPIEVYYDFMTEKFGLPERFLTSDSVNVEYNEFSDTYHIKGKNQHHSIRTSNEFGTERANAFFILEKSLNFKTMSIYDKEEQWIDGERKQVPVLNVNETMLARAKQDHIKQSFKTWLFSDPSRASMLLKRYNDRFNRIRLRNYDGSHLTFEGMNQEFSLRPHQSSVVSRILTNGRALMAHEVGAGKTASMISAGMLMKDQGIIKKPLYCVPNHLTDQFGQELLRFFPSKKVLITTKKDFEKKNRQKFVSRIATGDYDAVIIGHSQMEKIPLSKERREAMIKAEIADVKNAINLTKRENSQSWSLKQMVSFEKKLKENLKNLQNESSKDNLLTFEELGVDFLFVDEAHTYKNLYTYTKMSNVAGVNTSNSLRATDMFMKCQYLLEKHNGRGVVLATGTPISNSMSELYTLQRFLQPDELARMKLTSFDRWASTFGEIVNAPELNPEGTNFRMKTRFAKFHNLPELMNSFQLVADIQTSDMLQLPVPKIETGKPQLIVSEQSSYQQMKMEELGERSEQIRLGAVDPSEDNMLKITHEAKLMAIDPRLLDEEAPFFPEGKLAKCTENVHRIWQDSAPQRSTQLIFSDSGTPKANQFNVYDEIKRLLIAKGIPEKEIAFIHSAKNDRQREALFEQVRNGEVRVLLGSTEKLGTGTNIQQKLLAVHHVDVPWRPSDMTQRDGRLVRQGNENSTVQIYRYVAKNSFDSYLWQTQENKLKFINQIMTGKSISRSAEDIDQTQLSAAEAKSLATNNPLVLEKLTLDKKVMELQLLQGSWQSARVSLLQKVETNYPNRLKEIETQLPLITSDKAQVESAFQGNLPFSMELGGTTYTDRKEALSVFNALLPSQTATTEEKIIGSYKGFSIAAKPSTFGQVLIHLERESVYQVAVDHQGTGSLTRIDNVLKTVPEKLNDLKNEQRELLTNWKEAEIQLERPFEQAEELDQLLTKQSELVRALERGETTLPEDKKIQSPTVSIQTNQLDSSSASAPTNEINRL